MDFRLRVDGTAVESHHQRLLSEALEHCAAEIDLFVLALVAVKRQSIHMQG